jgi:hypothetical protein
VAQLSPLLTMKTAPVPAIKGVAKVGKTLAALPGTWPAGTALSYQWFAGAQLISGASGASVKLTATEYKKKITVKVTGKLGAASRTEASKSTTAVKRGALSKVRAPKLKGKAVVGTTLRAKVTAWGGGVAKSYRWYANNKRIKGATSAKFKITKKYEGKRIRVKVTGKKAGYAPVAKWSKRTARVKP